MTSYLGRELSRKTGKDFELAEAVNNMLLFGSFRTGECSAEARLGSTKLLVGVRGEGREIVDADCRQGDPFSLDRR